MEFLIRKNFNDGIKFNTYFRKSNQIQYPFYLFEYYLKHNSMYLRIIQIP